MNDLQEKDSIECFRRFLENRNIQNMTELVDYVTYLEDVKSDHEVLKYKIASLNNLAKEMY